MPVTRANAEVANLPPVEYLLEQLPPPLSVEILLDPVNKDDDEAFARLVAFYTYRTISSFKLSRDWTLLHLAAALGKPKICAFLCRQSLYWKANTINRYGNSPLHYACANGHFEVAKVLTRNGANISAIGDDGKTPLFYACKSGHTEIVDFLLDFYSDQELNFVESSRRNSALHMAAQWSANKFPTLMKMLERGADPFLKNRAGQTPMDLAESVTIRNAFKSYLHTKEEQSESTPSLIRKKKRRASHF